MALLHQNALTVELGAQGLCLVVKQGADFARTGGVGAAHCGELGLERGEAGVFARRLFPLLRRRRRSDFQRGRVRLGLPGQGDFGGEPGRVIASLLHLLGRGGAGEERGDLLGREQQRADPGKQGGQRHAAEQAAGGAAGRAFHRFAAGGEKGVAILAHRSGAPRRGAGAAIGLSASPWAMAAACSP